MPWLTHDSVRFYGIDFLVLILLDNAIWYK